MEDMEDCQLFTGSLKHPFLEAPELPSKFSVNGETISRPKSIATAPGSFFAEVKKKKKQIPLKIP